MNKLNHTDRAIKVKRESANGWVTALGELIDLLLLAGQRPSILLLANRHRDTHSCSLNPKSKHPYQ